MAEWNGYVLLQRPGAMAEDSWPQEKLRLKAVLDSYPTHPLPAKRLHSRASRDGQQEIVEAVFDPAALEIPEVAVIFGGLEADWAESRAAAVAFLHKHLPDWDEPVLSA